jgi:putative nucleotidyltransferase with HDIG domain
MKGAVMKLELRKVLHNLGALTDLGAGISSLRDFDEVTRISLHTLLGTLAIPRGAIARFTSRPRALTIIAAKGIAKVTGEKIALAPEDVQKLGSKPRAVEVAQKSELTPLISRNQPLVDRLRAHLMVPLVVHGELMGAIFLSEKFTRRPYDENDLEIVNALSRHIGLAIYNHRLMESMKRKADESRRLYREMRQIYRDTVKAFGAAIDLKDTYTSGHSDRVARYSEAIAREMGLTGKELEHIGVAGYLHDIGKIVVDRSIINNPRPLTDREYRELNRHVTTGYEILKHIRQPWKEIAYMTKCHHEKVDGSGYPQGLSGDEIPLGSRIVTLADSFDAMMTDRPYRARLPLHLALVDVRDNAGKHFDRPVVVAFCRLLLKEISGATRDRVLLPMIGLKFDRQAIIQTLESMIREFGDEEPAEALKKAAG